MNKPYTIQMLMVGKSSAVGIKTLHTGYLTKIVRKKGQ